MRLPAKTTAKTGVNIDLGQIAGGFAIAFFMAAIVDSLFNIIGLDANDMIGLFVILDLLTAAAWIWGTNNKVMRGIATVCAVLVTALAVLILVRHGLAGDAKARSSLIAAGHQRSSAASSGSTHCE